MKRYLVAEIDVREEQYSFYILNNKEYIEFLKNEGAIKKSDYLNFSYKMKPDAEIYYDFKSLFNAINQKNITIVDTFQF